jgi:SecD/SecF fusion protein
VSTRRSQLLLVGAILAALVGVALVAIPGSPLHKKPTLGLDLQGGLEVVLEARPEKDQKLTPSDLDRSVDIMRRRVDKLGVSEPEIRKQGSNQIVIELPGVHNANDAAAILGKTAQLELYDLENSALPPTLTATGDIQPSPSIYALLSPIQSKAKEGTPAAWFLFDKKQKLVAGPTSTREALLGGPKVKRLLKDGGLPKGYTALAQPEKTTILTCSSATADLCPPGIAPPVKPAYYLFKKDPASTASGGPFPQMTGGDLKLSGTRQDFDPQTNQPVVLMQFTGAGSKKFQNVTKDLWIRGRIRGQPQHFVIVLDNEIRSFPQIDPTDRSLSNGISGNAQITGIGSIGQAKDLALVLQTGALPVRFVTVERTDVSATLGKDSLQEAKKAAIAGLIVVALFLLLLYRFLGLVAVVGLGIYAAFLYAAILLLNVTLTLPGFAGLILTIGVAADANVVIFERIKEEYRAGKSIRAAISTGYQKGFHTIIDANVVTAITAMVLFLVATAGVKGFALMLLIGTGISLITAVAATRAMLGLLAGFSWFDNPQFMGAAGSQGMKFLQIDYMKRRYLWLGISGVVVAISVISLSTQWLNLGIDFKGGTQVTFKTSQPVALDEVRAQAARVGQADAVIQGRGNQSAGKYEDFQLRTESLTPKEQAQLTTDLQESVGATSLGVKNVSSSFGKQIRDAALLAIVFSLLLIVAYIAIRFDIKFAVPVIIAMVHDVIITIGIYSLTQREVTASTVAAVLTVLGYSIYDTIIIFDRIRENVPLMRRAPFAQIANISLWETIRRSLATTFITLLPVVSLLFFGGDTLKDFAFALLVGIASGAYSSIFVAAPLLTMWKEREPEYARRKEVPLEEVLPASIAAPPSAAAPAPEPALAAPAAPTPAPPPVGDGAQSKRERRRQRRRSRPHGRAR